jgi:periplasmic divalent cation tolerance protein
MLPGDARTACTLTCSNLYAPIQSTYRWQGKLEQAQEHQLLLKTRAELGDAAEAAIRALHPYDVPSILRFEVTANADYIAWVHAQARAP